MNSQIPFSSGFGEILKVARKRKRLTQKQLAQHLGVHYNTISSWELGTHLPESRGLILELARILDLDEQETRLLLESSLTALSPHWNVPHQRNPFFAGRDDILHQLHDALHHQDNVAFSQSCTLRGLGGIGKTQTVIEYAYRYANDYSAVFWIGAQTYESILSSFVSVADVLNLPEKREQEQGRVVAAVIRWLNSHDQWLLIFDSAEDIKLVKSFLPAARCGFLLFTSCRQDFSISAQVLDLEPMTLEEGMRFLLRRTRLPGPLTVKDEAIMREIALVMDGLPLALDQAGSYIEATRCSLSDYLRLYQSSHLSLLDERDAHTDHPLSVIKTFTLAFEQLEQHNAQAAELLTVCAFLSPEPIPDVFFREGAAYLGPTFEVLAADSFVFLSAVRALLMYSLLQRNADTQTITIHRLVQAVLKGRLSKMAQQTWATRVTRAMSALFPSDEMTQAHYWQNCERLLPHALACIELSEQWSDDKISYLILICHVAAYLSERARYTGAQQLLQRAVYISERVLGPRHFLVAEALHNLGTLYLRQGKYAEAESLLQRALNIREQTLGNNHPQVAVSLNVLAALYTDQGKYEQAESLYARGLRIREQALGADSSEVATLLNNLADLYREQGKYEQAEPLFQRALQIWEQGLGPNHFLVADTLDGLALLYGDQEKYEQAEPLFQRALQIREQALGSQHPDIADSLYHLARLHQLRQQATEALSLYEQALALYKQTLGVDHPRTSAACNAYVQFLLDLGRMDEAAHISPS
jgi:tetratricopeptide (TPR) repeat protein